MFDLSTESWNAQLPPPGRHGATIADAGTVETDSAVYLKVIYALGDGKRIEDFFCIDASPASGRYSWVAQGRARLLALCKALTLPEQFGSTDDIVAGLLGGKLIVLVAHSTKEGLPVPVVKAVMAAS